MRIVSWNLGHQTKPRSIKPGFGEAIASLGPDVLLLNEFAYDAKKHAPMLAELSEMGLSHWRVSEHLNRPAEKPGAKPGRNNQVLAVARMPLEVGELRGPPTQDNGGETNFLHIKPEGVPFAIVGIRVPTYKGATLNAYWEEFATLAAQVADRPIVFVGDFNADPERKQFVGGAMLARLREAGWQVPYAGGSWSFVGGARIDHALASSLVAPPSARYVVEEGRIHFAGKESPAISDHAALVVDIPQAPHLASLLQS